MALEFYTTYDVATGISDVEAQTISFRMWGESYALSLSEFTTHMGIYTVEDLLERIDSMVPIMDVERFQLWHQITGMSLYDASTYKASNILHPRIWILHRLIATAFYRFLEFVCNVTHGDLYILS